MHPKQIIIDDYDYPLPESRIAQFPLEQRDRSKLLIFKDNEINDDFFCNLPAYLPENSLLIFNETRVIHARLIFRKASGSQIEIFCLEPVAPSSDYQLAFQQREWTEWKCLVGNSKRWKSGELILSFNHNEKIISLSASRTSKTENGTSGIIFRWDPPDLTFAEILEHAGKIPLPPYIHRQPVSQDEITYQTIYARQHGSVAAPTAGLHFSPEVMTSVTNRKIELLECTLHVGAGTFRPVSASTLAGHEMHAEQVFISMDNLKKLRDSYGKSIILVGTTTVRIMESLYWHGVKLIKEMAIGPEMDIRQWDPYKINDSERISKEESLARVILECEKYQARGVGGHTSLMIAPGYTFRYPDILITNFHQPRSTLLLLIAAFIGEAWRKAYHYALENGFRFLSYGDSCLFFKPE
ncbi:MAG: S-adenosylmethionine:tRNA ribosyltransferase-isomerase [Bacteroidales bacterium]|nr:S-adenosylmethionine:tRNA ribosyltransferase-isomerase [Bacteroidales bacterium]